MIRYDGLASVVRTHVELVQNDVRLPRSSPVWLLETCFGGPGLARVLHMGKKSTPGYPVYTVRIVL